jgi:hypothetical protein
VAKVPGVATRAVHRRARPAGPNQPGAAAAREVALPEVTGRVRRVTRPAVDVAMLHLAEADDFACKKRPLKSWGRWEPTQFFFIAWSAC